MAVPFIEKQEANNHTGRYRAFQHEGTYDEWVVGREIEAKMLLERGSYDWHSAANSERLDDGDKWQPEQERIPPDVFKVDRPQCFKDGQRFHGVIIP